MDCLSLLVRYKAWADDLLLAAVSGVPAGALAAPQPIVFGSLIRTLNHAYAMDHVWQSHLLGKRHDLSTRNPEHHPGMEVLAAAQRKIDDWYIDYTGSLSDREAGEIVAFEFIGGGHGRMSRRDILLHVVNHATYHRGHVTAMLYQLDVAPPATDLPVFLRARPVGA